MANISSNKEYGQFLKEIKGRILNAQYSALKAVNKELISLYWDLGRMIIEKQKKYNWGDSIVESLARDLQAEFPGVKGFSSQNLWYIRQFYFTYMDNPKLQPLVGEISWTKNILIMGRCKTDNEKEFYISMVKKFGWTKNVLIHHLENDTFHKYKSNQTNFDLSVPEKYKKQAKLAVKDEYSFGFLDLEEEHSEKELEFALIDKIRKFLLEIGDYFCFVGSQFRIEIEGEEFFIDLLLYHRKLKSLVAIELKVGSFKPEYVGKMQFYLSALDSIVKLDEENPSMGIIICKSKSRTIVEYTLKESNKPIGVATYRASDKLPDNISRYMPTKKEFTRKLESFYES